MLIIMRARCNVLIELAAADQCATEMELGHIL